MNNLFTFLANKMSATYLDVSGRDGEGEPQEFTPSSGLGIDTVMEEDLGDVLVEEIPNIKIGICAMNKKTKSTPMQEILSRIMRFEFVDVVVFSDDMILNHQVEEWPLCDALISFYSSGFPLDKAIEYSKLRNPFVLNDLEMQYTLLDRCAVYELLKEGNIETPRYAILMRDEDGNPIDTNFVELEDSIQIGNVVFQKPFVEKPVDAEDHNVFIYYPSSAGGGSQRLFRKVGSRSSVYSAESCVRKFGSYIYEDFVPTDGTDVKVYTVGPEYAHAEARKSPSLDGKVERDSQGKEIRYPVILNPYEKEMAHKVCELFKQTVCGFDLLRTHGTSYVCDVNGFSFVKTSKKYYDDCSQVLVSRILQELAPQLYKPYNLLEESSEDRPITDTLNGTMMELRCVIGIIRHGDRTPKQKLKMEIRHPRFIQLFKRHNSHNEKKLKLKRPKQLQEILDIVRDLLEEHHAGVTMFENPNKLRQLKNVLEMYGHFSGINRKIQLKYLGFVKDTPDSSGNEERQAKQGYESESEMFLNYNKEKAYKSSKDEEAILLIMKWGGELTATGKIQAEELGRAFRCMYPGGQGEYSNLPGCGLLRLHSTYRHDLKIYASDEGRVQMTAAAFAKGFLALEGELTPILVHLVRSDKNTTEMLDTSDQATKLMTRVKQRLHEILSQDKKFTDEDISKLAPTKSASLIEAIKKVQNPREMCAKLANMVHDLTEQLKDMINQKKYDPRDPFLYHDDTLELMTHRWIKLDKDFRLKHGMYDISLIPDIYDGIKYDLQHNNQLGLKNTTEMYNVAKALADIVIPQEYGLSAEEKVKIARKMCIRLLRKIQGDLKHADTEDTHTRLNPEYSQSVITPHRHVRTRLYFTSESHVHSIINALRYGKMFESENQDAQWKRAIDFLSEIPELHYMTQIVLMLYEDPTADLQSDNRFHIELHFSSGAKTLNDQSRGRSAEPKPSRPVSPGVPSTHPESPPGDTSEGDKPAPEPGDRKAEPGSPAPFASVETHLSESSGIRDSEKTQTETKPMDLEDACGEQDKMEETDKGYNSELYSEEDDKNYNERPRCAIGMEDFSDPSSSPVSIDKLEGSQLLASESDMGAVDEEMPARYGQRRPSRSSSEGNLKKASEYKEATSVSLENSEEINRRNSDSEAFCRTDLQEKQEASSEAYVAVDSSMPDETKEMEGDRRPSFHRARSLSVSYLNETPSDMELPTQSNSVSKSGESRASCMEAETMTPSCNPRTHKMSFFGFGQTAELEIALTGADKRKQVDVKNEDGKKERLFLFYDGESVTGKVHINLKNPGKKLEHQGIKIEFIGQIELFYDRGNHHEFTSLVRELARPGELTQSVCYDFEFVNVEKPYETYTGANVRLRYFLRVTIVRRLSDVTKEMDLAVHTLSSYPDMNTSIKMEVGIEDCLHIEFEYNKSKYHLKDVIVGKIYFLLVRIKIKHMELAIIKRETTGTGPNTYNENETIAKYEIMDGAPVRGESIPIRLFLAGYELTPTFKDVNKKFSVRFFLNLVLVDEEERRYFKQQEIILWRKGELRKKQVYHADATGRFERAEEKKSAPEE